MTQNSRALQMAQLDPSQLRDTAADVHDVSSRIRRFLSRHLSDEEDLVVPALLHHKLRG